MWKSVKFELVGYVGLFVTDRDSELCSLVCTIHSIPIEFNFITTVVISSQELSNLIEFQIKINAHAKLFFSVRKGTLSLL